MRRLYRGIDVVSLLLARLAELVTLLLVASMIYEVAARYVFDAPTIWAFDIAYMSTGVLFVLGAAQALRDDAHVRIDFLASRLPRRFVGWIDGIAFLVLLCPIFGALAWIAGRKAWGAYLSGQVETVSPWAPLMWPFYSFLALGLTALTLQLAVQGLRAFTGDIPPASHNKEA